jgi:hypothetical protein
MNYIDAKAIRAEYAPYHTMPEFERAYMIELTNGVHETHHRDVAAQAYDRGCEAAMRVLKAAYWIEHNVGSN